MSAYEKTTNKFTFLRANLQIKMQRPENAILIIQGRLDKMLLPDENLLRLLVVAYWNSRKFNASLEVLSQLCQLHPEKFGYKWELGINLLGLGRYSEALSYFESFINVLPDNEHAHFGVAYSYVCLGRFKEAEKIIVHATKIAPWNPGVLLITPLLYLETNRFDIIEERLKEYIDNYPSLYPGYSLMGDHIQYRLHRPDASLYWYAKSEDLLSNLKMNNYLQRFSYVTDELREHSLDAYTEALIKTGHHEQALKKIYRYIKKDKKNYRSKARLIEYHLSIGDNKAAEQEARHMYQKHPAMHESLYLLSAALLKQKRFAEARLAAVDSVKWLNENARAWVALGHVEQYLENSQSAIDAYLVALKLEPFAPDVLEGLSICYQQIGKHGESLQMARKRAILDPQNPDVWFSLKEIYQKMGREFEAEGANRKGCGLQTARDK